VRAHRIPVQLMRLYVPGDPRPPWPHLRGNTPVGKDPCPKRVRPAHLPESRLVTICHSFHRAIRRLTQLHGKFEPSDYFCYSRALLTPSEGALHTLASNVSGLTATNVMIKAWTSTNAPALTLFDNSLEYLSRPSICLRRRTHEVRL
jgi:hypothetical protein